MANENITILFTSFKRLNTQLNVEGTGIGLVIFKKLIELMGASLGAATTQGEGRTFWVEVARVNHIY